jgi:uncharacterized membrane protein YeaQ/YmgE (transglycosylase-associated protein family)
MIKWAATLGLCGFLAGFIGPLILVPEANQGPLLGIFITGPIGFLAGIILWALSKHFAWTPKTQKRVLYTGCAALVGAVITVSLTPNPKWLGWIYQVELISCQAPAAEVDTALKEWRERVAHSSWKEPRANWEAEIASTLREDKGSVVRAKILVEKVVRAEKPLSRNEKISVFPIQTDPNNLREISFYLPQPCSELTLNSKSYYFVGSDRMHIMANPNLPWPPTAVSDLLIKATLEPLPDWLKDY